MRGNWGVRKEREITHVLMYAQKLVLSSFRLSSEGLSHTACIWNTLRNLTQCICKAVSECAIRSWFHSLTYSTVRFKTWDSESNLILEVLGFWENITACIYLFIYNNNIKWQDELVFLNKLIKYVVKYVKLLYVYVVRSSFMIGFGDWKSEYWSD